MALEHYYTAKEARHVLGDIHPTVLSQYVESGKLRRYIPPGKKHALYLKTEVDALAKEIRDFYSGRPGAARKDREENGRRFSIVNSS